MDKTNKPLYLFVGKSGSGKTTAANILEAQFDYTQLQSYTTRPQRHENETGHIFISEEEFDELENIVAYTKYNNYRYCATEDQLNHTDVYVVDIPGVETLLAKYTNKNRTICIIYFNVSINNRILRMVDRGDSDHAIIERLLQDEELDWERQLNHLSWCYKHVFNQNVVLHTIDANTTIDKVVEQIIHMEV